MDAGGESNAERARGVAPALLAWYDIHARDLPWRLPPGAPAPLDDPGHGFRVWLSEIMLQQTTVASVKPYFARFTERWPDVTALARADEGEVMAAWAGLGYYARARKLIECARAVAAGGGRFPDSEEGLRALPGLGAYTAAAVAAIAFGRRAVVVDANVERVVSRLFAIGAPLPAARPAIRAAADTITPDIRAGDFAQAMMDLGAGICRPRAPSCLICPLAALCAARGGGRAEAYPVKPTKPTKPERAGHAYWIERAGVQGPEVWVVRRASRGLLGGMRALPDDGWTARADGTGDAAPPGAILGQVRHVFTHFALTLTVVRANRGPLAHEVGEWWPLARLDDAGLPTVFARAATVALASG